MKIDQIDISNQRLLSLEELKRLHTIINDVYLKSEAEFWSDGYERISLRDLERLNKAALLFTVFADGKISGCLRVGNKNKTTATFSMLSVDFPYRGQRLASKLILNAENWARNKGKNYMELELLIPQKFRHPDKEKLSIWYQKLGYIPMHTSDFSQTHPELDPLLKVPCNFVVYRKDLEDHETPSGEAS